MQEAIFLAEKQRVKNITTHPCAPDNIITQEKLEEFYLNFRINTFLIRKHQIEFKIVLS